jgi:hypothetical protein
MVNELRFFFFFVSLNSYFFNFIQKGILLDKKGSIQSQNHIIDLLKVSYLSMTFVMENHLTMFQNGLEILKK